MIRHAARSLDFTTVAADDQLETALSDWADLDLSAETASLDEKIGTQRDPVSRTVRIVGLLAFGQSLLFLVIWLLICASAGAAPAKKAEFKPDLQTSSYNPTKTRDPFEAVGGGAAGSAAASSVALQLEGILFDAPPSAVVNGQLLTLNKVVFLPTPSGDVQLKAIEITRDRVVVAVGEGAGAQNVKLFLNQQSQAPPTLK